MAKPPVHEADSPPTDYPQVTPRDLHPTSDIRFVITEITKLSILVDRLIKDVGKLEEKVDGVRHQVTFVKGALWVIGGVMAVVAVFTTWYFSGKISITLLPGA